MHKSATASGGATRAGRPANKTTRLLRMIFRAAVALLALWGLISLIEPRTIGQFRSIEGQRAYRAAYERALATVPPDRTVDVLTDLGTVRAYVWQAQAAAEQTPVLLLPGRTSGVPMWLENLRPLTAHHRVIAFDALGDAGLSAQTAPFTSLDDQAIWIDQVVTELAPDGVHLVGHSFGGATAVVYARRHPERVRSLTLLEPVFTFALPPAGLFGWAVLGSLPFLPESLRERALAEIGGGERAEPGDPIATMIDQGVAHYAAQLPTPRVLDDAQLAEVDLPVYVAIAERDSMAGGARAAERARQLPNGTVEVWPNTTHSLPMQVPDALDRRLQEFWRA